MTGVRPLCRKDIPALQTLDASAHGSAWSHRTFVDEIEQDNRIHLVAEVSDGLIGHAAAWLDGASCRITNVAVSEEHAAQGHGTGLLLELIEQALANHRFTNMQLEVRATNRPAQRMYRRFGFMPVGVERDFYDRADSQGGRDALIMAVADVCDASWRRRLAEIRTEHTQQQNDNGAAA